MVPSATNPLVLYYDNNGAIAQSKEPRNHKSQNHIERKHHIIRDIVQRGEIKVTKIVIENNVTNPCIKAITKTAFNRHLESIGIREMPELL